MTDTIHWRICQAYNNDTDTDTDMVW